MRSRGTRLMIGALISLMLTACGATPDDGRAALDAALNNATGDPAIEQALADPIIVDPALVRQANINAVRSAEKPPGNGIPMVRTSAPIDQVRNAPGGSLLHAPDPSAAAPCPDCGPDGPATFGALAREMAQRQQRSACMDPLDYGMQWAEQLHAPFALYPGAALTDAAGADGPQCSLRAVSFLTGAAMADVIDFYYTQARRAGYDAMHQRLAGQHILSGTQARGTGAYFITFARAPGGGTAVDMIVSRAP